MLDYSRLGSVRTSWLMQLVAGFRVSLDSRKKGIADLEVES